MPGAARGRAADLRSLDAIHLAAARGLGHDLGTITTYDMRMAEAATHLVRVLPGRSVVGNDDLTTTAARNSPATADKADEVTASKRRRAIPGRLVQE